MDEGIPAEIFHKIYTKDVSLKGEIKIEDRGLTSVDLRELVKALSFNNEIRKINLAFNKIEDIRVLRDCQLREIDLLGNCIKHIEIINEMSNIEVINFGYNEVTDEGIEWLDKNNTLREVYFRECKNIKDLSFLTTNRRLKKIDFSYCDIDSLDFLDKNNTLEEVNLAGNDIDCVNALAQCKVKKINLSYNPIEDIDELMKVLKKNRSILQIKLKGIELNKKNMENLREILDRNTLLHHDKQEVWRTLRLASLILEEEGREISDEPNTNGMNNYRR